MSVKQEDFIFVRIIKHESWFGRIPMVKVKPGQIIKAFKASRSIAGHNFAFHTPGGICYLPRNTFVELSPLEVLAMSVDETEDFVSEPLYYH